jgi:hypothetical protein
VVDRGAHQRHAVGGVHFVAAAVVFDEDDSGHEVSGSGLRQRGCGIIEKFESAFKFQAGAIVRRNMAAERLPRSYTAAAT